MNAISAPKRRAATGMWLQTSTRMGATRIGPMMIGAMMFSGAPESAEAQVTQPDQDLGAALPRKDDPKSWTLGAGVAEMPRYFGSDEYQAQPAPLIDLQYKRFFARTGEGIGFNVLKNDRFTAGISVNWIQGYDVDDAPAGINEVKDALGARLFATARFNGAVATLAATQAVTESDRGMLVNASLAYPIRATRKLMITPSVNATWGNEKYLDGYFGVDSLESAASGFNAYQPVGNGFRDVAFRVGVAYRITDKVTAVGSFGVSHLLDKAADSPLVEKETYALGLVGLTYTFGR